MDERSPHGIAAADDFMAQNLVSLQALAFVSADRDSLGGRWMALFLVGLSPSIDRKSGERWRVTTCVQIQFAG